MQILLGDVLDAENPGKDQVEAEQDGAGHLGLALEAQLHFNIGVRERFGVDVNLNVDRGLLLSGRQRARCVRILEREILDVLGKNIELRRLTRRRPAIGVGHLDNPPAATASYLSAMAGWLTQAARVHKDRGASNLAERDGTFHPARTVDRRYPTAVESDRPADHR